MVIFDEVNDVRIVGVTTVTGLIGVAIIGMEWEARVSPDVSNYCATFYSIYMYIM